MQTIQQNEFIPIVFPKPIPINLTDDLIKYCTANLKFIDLQENFSAERGFELLCKNNEEYRLVSPQSSKQLRFIKIGDYIVALRYKNCIISWNNNEVEKLRYFIEKFIEKLQK